MERLTLAYLEAHPRDAARVLERLPTAHAAELLRRVPARVAGPVLGAMLPTAAARNLAEIEDATAAALLAALGAQAAVAVLRHVDEPRRTRLLEGLPTGTAVASRLLLGYPEDSAGAWADPEVVALPADARADEAIERVRAAGTARVDELYVVGANDRLLGTLELSALLRALPGATLGGLAARPLAVLPAATPLAGAAAHRGWQHAAGLPVVEHGERLVGVLRRATLMRALARNRLAPEAPADASVIAVLAGGYWLALSNLLAALVALLPGVPPVAARKEGTTDGG